MNPCDGNMELEQFDKGEWVKFPDKHGATPGGGVPVARTLDCVMICTALKDTN